MQLDCHGKSIAVTGSTSVSVSVGFGRNTSVNAPSPDTPVLSTSQAVLSFISPITFVADMLTSSYDSVFFIRGEGWYR
jgi:hypothetical protein